MKNLLAKINAEIETFKTESELHIEKGNKAAGARKATLDLKKFRKVSVEESKNKSTINYKTFGISKGIF